MKRAKTDFGSLVPELLAVDVKNERAIREAVLKTTQDYLQQLAKRHAIGDVADHIAVTVGPGEESHTLVIDMTAKTVWGAEMIQRMKRVQDDGETA